MDNIYKYCPFFLLYIYVATTREQIFSLLIEAK
jgi:hypothetical protein